MSGGTTPVINSTLAGVLTFLFKEGPKYKLYSAPNGIEGVIKGQFNEINKNKEFKLKAGEIVIYPSSHLHSVKKVEYGERIVCVGWIESYVKSIEEREYLFDLDAGARGLLAKNGRSDELDLIFKSYSNLLRLLGD